jgi:hypothetical protein
MRHLMSGLLNKFNRVIKTNYFNEVFNDESHILSEE